MHCQNAILLHFLPKQKELQDGQDALAGEDDKSWDLPLGAMILSVRQIGLGGWMQQECMAIENELGSWQQAAHFSERLPALR